MLYMQIQIAHIGHTHEQMNNDPDLAIGDRPY